jgi:hypothetical protein
MFRIVQSNVPRAVCRIHRSQMRFPGFLAPLSTRSSPPSKPASTAIPTAQTVSRSLQENENASRSAFPTTVGVLSGASTLPLVAIAGLTHWAPELYNFYAPIAFQFGGIAATLAGAVHVGLAIASPASMTPAKASPVSNLRAQTQFFLGVTPAALGWLAVQNSFLHPIHSPTVLVGAFGVALLADFWAYWRQLIPPWFLQLRLATVLVSSVALSSVGVGYYRFVNEIASGKLVYEAENELVNDKKATGEISS